MATTSIWGVQDALKSLIDTAVTTARVDLGWPDSDPDDTHVWIAGDVQPTRQDAVTTTVTAGAVRQEAYELDVIVYARRPGGYTAVRDVVKALAITVEQTVQGNHALGGVAFLAQVAGHELEEGITEEDRELRLTIRVSITAYVTVA